MITASEYSQYYPKLLARTIRLTGNNFDAKDVIHDTYLWLSQRGYPVTSWWGAIKRFWRTRYVNWSIKQNYLVRCSSALACTYTDPTPPSRLDLFTIIQAYRNDLEQSRDWPKLCAEYDQLMSRRNSWELSAWYAFQFPNQTPAAAYRTLRYNQHHKRQHSSRYYKINRT